MKNRPSAGDTPGRRKTSASLRAPPLAPGPTPVIVRSRSSQHRRESAQPFGEVGEIPPYVRAGARRRLPGRRSAITVAGGSGRSRIASTTDTTPVVIRAERHRDDRGRGNPGSRRSTRPANASPPRSTTSAARRQCHTAEGIDDRACVQYQPRARPGPDAARRANSSSRSPMIAARSPRAASQRTRVLGLRGGVTIAAVPGGASGRTTSEPGGRAPLRARPCRWP